MIHREREEKRQKCEWPRTIWRGQGCNAPKEKGTPNRTKILVINVSSRLLEHFSNRPAPINFKHEVEWNHSSVTRVNCLLRFTFWMWDLHYRRKHSTLPWFTWRNPLMILQLLPWITTHLEVPAEEVNSTVFLVGGQETFQSQSEYCSTDNAHPTLKWWCEADSWLTFRSTSLRKIAVFGNVLLSRNLPKGYSCRYSEWTFVDNC